MGTWGKVSFCSVNQQVSRAEPLDPTISNCTGKTAGKARASPPIDGFLSVT